MHHLALLLLALTPHLPISPPATPPHRRPTVPGRYCRLPATGNSPAGGQRPLHDRCAAIGRLASKIPAVRSCELGAINDDGTEISLRFLERLLKSLEGIDMICH